MLKKIFYIASLILLTRIGQNEASEGQFAEHELIKRCKEEVLVNKHERTSQVYIPDELFKAGKDAIIKPSGINIQDMKFLTDTKYGFCVQLLEMKMKQVDVKPGDMTKGEIRMKNKRDDKLGCVEIIFRPKGATSVFKSDKKIMFSPFTDIGITSFAAVKNKPASQPTATSHEFKRSIISGLSEEEIEVIELQNKLKASTLVPAPTAEDAMKTAQITVAKKEWFRKWERLSNPQAKIEEARAQLNDESNKLQWTISERHFIQDRIRQIKEQMNDLARLQSEYGV